MFSFQNKSIILISPNHWGNMHISKHHYAKALAKRGNQVFFISPPDLTSKLFQIKEVEPHLFVVNYYPIFRGKSFLPTFLFNLLVRLQIKYLLLKIKTKPDVVWSFTSTLYYHLDWWKAPLTIFHPMDQLNDEKAVIIAKYSDIIFSCSQYILEEMKDINVPKYFINHGVAPSYINHTFIENTNNTTVNAGYIGNLFIKNLDRILLKSLITSFPTIHFHFYGATVPNQSNISAWVTEESLDFVTFLKNATNVTCHGVIPSNELPQQIEGIDVFLICYTSNNENLITNSHKILEYLSTGKTVVSTFVEQYEDFDLIEMCAKNMNTKFIQLFEKVTTHLPHFNSVENQQKRKKIAHQNSYYQHIETVEKYINEITINEKA